MASSSPLPPHFIPISTPSVPPPQPAPLNVTSKNTATLGTSCISYAKHNSPLTPSQDQHSPKMAVDKTKPTLFFYIFNCFLCALSGFWKQFSGSFQVWKLKRSWHVCSFVCQRPYLLIDCILHLYPTFLPSWNSKQLIRCCQEVSSAGSSPANLLSNCIMGLFLLFICRALSM